MYVVFLHTTFGTLSISNSQQLLSLLLSPYCYVHDQPCQATFLWFYILAPESEEMKVPLASIPQDSPSFVKNKVKRMGPIKRGDRPYLSLISPLQSFKLGRVFNP